MTPDHIAAYLLFVIVAAGTPGPSNVMITATGAAAGFTKGLPCALGASAGMGILLFAAALGLGQVVVALPILAFALKLAGAAFLMWLAWKIATAGTGTGTVEAQATGFVGALLFQWMNPKGWLVAVSAAGSFLPGVSQTPFAHAAALGVLFFAAALPCALVWLAVGAALRLALKNRRTARAFNVIMALSLAFSVLLLFR